MEEPSLPLSEIQELDWQTQTHIYYIRDEVKYRTREMRQCSDCSTGTIHPRGSTCPLDPHMLVEEVFEEEFKTMDTS